MLADGTHSRPELPRGKGGAEKGLSGAVSVLYIVRAKPAAPSAYSDADATLSGSALRSRSLFIRLSGDGSGGGSDSDDGESLLAKQSGDCEQSGGAVDDGVPLGVVELEVCISEVMI